MYILAKSRIIEVGTCLVYLLSARVLRDSDLSIAESN